MSLCFLNRRMKSQFFLYLQNMILSESERIFRFLENSHRLGIYWLQNDAHVQFEVWEHYGNNTPFVTLKLSRTNALLHPFESIYTSLITAVWQ